MYRNIKTFIVFLITSSILVGCNDQEEIKEVSMEDFVPKAKRDYSFEQDSLAHETVKKSLSDESFRVLVSAIVDGDWYEVERGFYLDRFGAKSSVKIDNSESYGVWYIYQFSDSLKTQNALYNWLDCFTNTCMSIQLEEPAVVRENFGQVWGNDTLLLVCLNDSLGIPTPKRLTITSYLEDDLNIHFYWKKNQKIQWETEFHSDL
jgi:hypothetical protein